MKSLSNKSPGEIFNITDDYPCSSEEVLEFAYSILGKKKPKAKKIKDANISDMTRSFYMENKKVSNHKVKQFLNWKPNYKSYKEGLIQILKDEK